MIKVPVDISNSNIKAEHSVQSCLYAEIIRVRKFYLLFTRLSKPLRILSKSCC